MQSSLSTYNDDTALVFEDDIAAHNRGCDQEDEVLCFSNLCFSNFIYKLSAVQCAFQMKLSATISDTTVSGDTMAVFETTERDKVSLPELLHCFCFLRSIGHK